MSDRPQPVSRSAFTLLELVVVIVVLAVLAAIAVPTFQAVVIRTQDEKALTELSALSREAIALAALSGSTDVPVSSFMDVGTGDSAAAPGVYAAAPAVRSVAYDVAHGGKASYSRAERSDAALVAERLGRVSHQNGFFSVAASDTDPSRFGLAMRSEYSGHCVFVTFDGPTRTGTRIADFAADGPGACQGAVALSSTPTDPEPTTPAPTPPSSAIVHPVVTNPIPDPAFPVPTGEVPPGTPQPPAPPAPAPGPDNPPAPPAPAKRAVTEEPVPGAAPRGTLPASAVAVSSFPSGHAEGTHHVYALLSDGSLYDVVDDGTCAASSSCKSHRIYPAGTFPGPLSLVSGGRPESSTGGVLRYDTLYVGSETGTIRAVSFSGGTWSAPRVVASGLDTSGYGLSALAYGACFDDSGDATVSHCVYAGGNNRWYQVDVTGAAAPLRVNLPSGYGDLSGLALVEEGGRAVLAASASSSSTGGYRTALITPRGELVSSTALDVWFPSGITTYGSTLYVGNYGGNVLSQHLPTGSGATVPTSQGVLSVHNHGLPGQLYTVETDGCVHKLEGGSDRALLCKFAPVVLAGAEFATALPSSSGMRVLYKGTPVGGSSSVMSHSFGPACDTGAGCPAPTSVFAAPEGLNGLHTFTGSASGGAVAGAAAADNTFTGSAEDKVLVHRYESDGRSNVGRHVVDLHDLSTGSVRSLGVLSETSYDSDGYWTSASSTLVPGPCFLSDGSTEQGTACYYAARGHNTSPTSVSLQRWRITLDGTVTMSVLNPEIAGDLPQGQWLLYSSAAGVTLHNGRPQVVVWYGAPHNGYGSHTPTYFDAVTGVKSTGPTPYSLAGAAVSDRNTAVLVAGNQVMVYGPDGASQTFTFAQMHGTYSSVTAAAGGKFLVRVVAREYPYGSEVRVPKSVQLIDPATGDVTQLVTIQSPPPPDPFQNIY